MGKITLVVEGSTVGTVANGGGIVIEKEVSEQDSTRLIQAFAQVYSSQLQEVTPRAVIEAWWNSMVNASIDRVRQVERENAARVAQDAVTPIQVG